MEVYLKGCYTKTMAESYTTGFPLLQKSYRKREYNSYTESERASVIYHWLFTNLGFRQLDQICLGLDGNESHGWQSMGIAHYLGLGKMHHAFFESCPPQDALNTLLKIRDEDPALALIWCYLRDWFIDEEVAENDPDYSTQRIEAVHWIQKTLLGGQLTSDIDTRLLCMGTARENDQTVRIGTRFYHYSKGALKESIKCLYDYTCQICKTQIYRPGWVRTLPRTVQWNYLNADAHHLKPLAMEGPDKMDNLLCLCPSCHRRFHTKEYRLKQSDGMLICEDVVLKTSSLMLEKHPIRL